MRNPQASAIPSPGNNPTEGTEFQRINHAIEILQQMEQAGFETKVSARNVLVFASHVRLSLELFKVAFKHHQAGNDVSGAYIASAASNILTIVGTGGSGRSPQEREALKDLQSAVSLMNEAELLLPSARGRGHNHNENLPAFLPKLEAAAVRAIEAGSKLGF